MNRIAPKYSLIVAAAPLFCGPAAMAAEEEPPLRVRAVEAWSGVFGGKETEFRFEISSADKGEVRASWSLAAGTATFARRETMLAVTPDKPGVLSARFNLPDAREGIIVPLDLTIAVELDGQKQLFVKRLWLFPDDPFALKKDWLEGLKISLFDPAGETSRVFTAAKVPFRSVRTIDQAAALHEGVLVVGEGVSWSKQRALAGTLLDLANQGVAVLALAPSEGLLPLPGAAAEDVPSALSVLMRHNDIITDLDKRLDAEAWPPDGEVQTSGMQIVAERGHVVGRFVEGSDAWPWIECRFKAPQGRLIVTGFAVVEHWDAGPTPRYLFARMLERLVDGDKKPPPDDAQPRAGDERQQP